MDQYRGTAHKRGYGHGWRQARAVFLVEHPMCAYCDRMGRVTAATVVDHIIPHKGNADLFWDRDNWQALCKPCHDSVKAQEERGKVIGCDASGLPVAASHHWQQG